jgi:hypothetical protein
MSRLPSHVRSQVKDRKIKSSKTTEFLLNMKQMGDEPTLAHLPELSDEEYTKALRWYNTVCSRDDAREYAEKYLKSSGRLNDAKRLKQVPDAWFPIHIGWIARMASRGAKLKQRSLDAFEKRLGEAFTKIPVESVETKTEKQPVNIQARVAEKASDLMYEIEKMIDDHGYVSTFSAYDWLTKKQASASLVPHMIRFFKPIAEEALEVTKVNCNSQLKEGYSNYTKAQLKARAQFYQKLMEEFDRYLGNTKKQRAPRARKVAPPEKRLKNFKFQKESKDLRLVSMDPNKVFDADEVWMLNTKYMVFTILKRSDGNSFDVSGSSFKNYDETTSKSYRLGRKPEKLIDEITKSGKRALGKILEKLKSTDLAARSNENTILLKVT